MTLEAVGVAKEFKTYVHSSLLVMFEQDVATQEPVVVSPVDNYQTQEWTNRWHCYGDVIYEHYVILTHYLVV